MNLPPKEPPRSMEDDLGLPEGFMKALQEEDPWSFVIKLCALFQSQLSKVIAHYFNEPGLYPEFSNLPFSETKAGLITFAEKVGILNRDEVRFLKALAQIRNKLAHEVKNCSFNWEEHIASLDSNQRKVFIQNFGLGLKDQPEVNPSEIPNFFGSNIQETVFLSAYTVASRLHIERLKASSKQLEIQLGAALLAQNDDFRKAREKRSQAIRDAES